MDESLDLIKLVENGKCGLLVVLKHKQFEQLWNEVNVSLLAYIIEFFDGVITFGFHIKKSDAEVQRKCEMIICTSNHSVKKILMKDTKLTNFILKFPIHFDQYTDDTKATFFRLLPEIIYTSYDTFNPIFSSHSFFYSILRHLDEEYVYEFVLDFIDRGYERSTEFLDRFDIFKVITSECYSNTERAFKFRHVYARLLDSKVDSSNAFDELLSSCYYSPIFQNILGTKEPRSWEMLWRISALSPLISAAKDINDEFLKLQPEIKRVANSRTEVVPYAQGILIQIACAKKEFDTDSLNALNQVLQNFFSGKPNKRYYSITKVTVQSLRRAGLLSDNILKKTNICNKIIKASHPSKSKDFEFWSSLSDVSTEVQVVSRDIVEEEKWDEVINNIQSHMSRSIPPQPSRTWIYILLVIIFGVVVIALMLYFGLYYDRDEYFFTDSDFDASTDI